MGDGDGGGHVSGGVVPGLLHVTALCTVRRPKDKAMNSDDHYFVLQVH